MKYVMVLSERHPAPKNWGPVFDTVPKAMFNRSYQDLVRILEKRAERRIPHNATELVVYMTGLKAYKEALYRLAIRRGIKLTCLRIAVKDLGDDPITEKYARNPGNYYISGYYNPEKTD